MPQKFARQTQKGGNEADFVGANSLTLAVADAVNVGTDGFLKLVAAAGERIHGFSTHIGTLAADNQTVGLIRPNYVPAVGVRMIYGTNVALAVTDKGLYMDFDTVTSGAFRVSTTSVAESSTGTGTGQLMCLDRDPDRDGTNTLGVFVATQPTTVSTGAV